MGHKVHPKIHRTQVIYTWDSKWFSKDDYAKCAKQDVEIRAYLEKKFKDAHIDAISVERGPKNMTVTIAAAKPGFIIGRGGQGLDEVRKYIERKLLQMSLKVKINVQEVADPARSAAVIAQAAVSDIERRLPFRRVMKQSIDRAMKGGALGVKIKMSGRLNGVEIARTEMLSAGKVPLITLRSDVDYSWKEAHTMYGKIGIKVWVYRGQVFGRKDDIQAEATPASTKRDESEKRTNRAPRQRTRKQSAPAA